MSNVIKGLRSRKNKYVPHPEISKEKLSMKTFLISVVLFASAPLFASDLYTSLSPLQAEDVLEKLFAHESFNNQDIEDLNRLWAERAISEAQVVKAFEAHRPSTSANGSDYQEVLLWHLQRNLSDMQIADEVTRTHVKRKLDEKSLIFGGAVKLITIIVDSHGTGVCRWQAPNSFLVLYAVKASFNLPSFPRDGASLVTKRI